MVYNVVIVGYGEIARRAHHPVLLSRSDTHVVGLVDVNFPKEEVVSVSKSGARSLPLTANPLKFSNASDAFNYFDGNIHAFCICTPKTVTLSVALECLNAAPRADLMLLGILLEKPPGDDASQLEKVVDTATSIGVSLMTACHTTACPARRHIEEWLFGENTNEKMQTGRRLQSIDIIWKESVRKWHPGQSWISSASGGGVTDMLFNPLSLIVSLFALESRSIKLVKADLFRPCNWQTAISGTATFILSIPNRVDGDSDQNGEIDVPLRAEFAFDYEPTVDDDNEEEIWRIDFVDSNGSVFKLTDGGAQAFIDSKRVTTEPTAEYPLRPEYEALYDQFIDLLNRNEGDAPSIVDCTTLAVLREISRDANYTVGPRFDF